MVFLQFVLLTLQRSVSLQAASSGLLAVFWLIKLAVPDADFLVLRRLHHASGCILPASASGSHHHAVPRYDVP